MFSQNHYDPPWYDQIPWIYIIIGTIILFWIFKKQTYQYHSHWQSLIPNFKYSSLDFYSLLEKELHSHNISGVDTSLIKLNEGGFGSPQRIYLRVTWKNYQYDMCCAPFGDGLFLSWWLTHGSSTYVRIFSRIPFIGDWLVRTFFPITYFQLDSASMFMTYCHQSVLTVADEITKESGVRIDPQERKPILKDIFKR